MYVGSDRPEIHQLYKHVKVEVSPQWYELGVLLLNADEVKQLKVIQSDHPGDSGKCCAAMFDYWLQVDTTASWDKLITALQNIHHGVLADKIKQMTSPSKYLRMWHYDEACRDRNQLNKTMLVA